MRGDQGFFNIFSTQLTHEPLAALDTSRERIRETKDATFSTDRIWNTLAEWLLFRYYLFIHLA